MKYEALLPHLCQNALPHQETIEPAAHGLEPQKPRAKHKSLSFEVGCWVFVIVMTGQCLEFGGSSLAVHGLRFVSRDKNRDQGVHSAFSQPVCPHLDREVSSRKVVCHSWRVRRPKEAAASVYRAGSLCPVALLPSHTVGAAASSTPAVCLHPGLVTFPIAVIKIP